MANPTVHKYGIGLICKASLRPFSLWVSTTDQNIKYILFPGVRLRFEREQVPADLRASRRLQED